VSSLQVSICNGLQYFPDFQQKRRERVEIEDTPMNVSRVVDLPSVIEVPDKGPVHSAPVQLSNGYSSSCSSISMGEVPTGLTLEDEQPPKPEEVEVNPCKPDEPLRTGEDDTVEPCFCCTEYGRPRHGKHSTPLAMAINSLNTRGNTNGGLTKAVFFNWNSIYSGAVSRQGAKLSGIIPDDGSTTSAVQIPVLTPKKRKRKTQMQRKLKILRPG